MKCEFCVNNAQVREINSKIVRAKARRDKEESLILKYRLERDILLHKLEEKHHV